MPSPPATLWTRRSLLTRASWGLLGSSLSLGFGAWLAALFPRVRATPPTVVLLGRPEELAIGEVSERWRKSHRLFLVRTAEGFYALRSVCTHLGCVPGWQPSQHKFKCFCHGSGFRADGVNFEGPAPRPLDRLRIWLDPGGRIAVDTGDAFRPEAWSRSDAFLPWKGEA